MLKDKSQGGGPVLGLHELHRVPPEAVYLQQGYIVP